MCFRRGEIIYIVRNTYQLDWDNTRSAYGLKRGRRQAFISLSFRYALLPYQHGPRLATKIEIEEYKLSVTASLNNKIMFL